MPEVDSDPERSTADFFLSPFILASSVNQPPSAVGDSAAVPAVKRRNCYFEIGTINLCFYCK